MTEEIVIKDKYVIKKEPFKYTKTHEWVRELEDGTWLYGITGYAATELGELAFVEFPEVGDTFDAEDSMGVIEALKTVSDYYAPFDCEVVEIHSELEDDANIIHEDCYGEGWMLKLKPTNGTDTLITAEEYAEIVEKEVEH
ncbi:MAG: glycine cleavage system protein GcvH [Candidatus Heimdallarchaeaceae archaeon]